MADDIIIKIGSQISPNIRKDLKDIGTVANITSKHIIALRKNIEQVSESEFAKRLVANQVKLNTANNKAIIAQAKLEKATADRLKQEDAHAISLAKLKLIEEQIAVTHSRLVTSEDKLIAKEIALSNQKYKLTVATVKQDLATAKLVEANLKYESSLSRLLTQEEKAFLNKQRLLQAEERSNQAKLRTSALQRREIQDLQMLADGTDRASMAKRRLEEALKRQDAAQKRQISTLRQNILQFASLTRAVRTLAIFYGAREFIESVDTFTNLGNRLALVTTNAGQAARIQKELFRIANDSRTSIDDVAQSYQRFDLALVQLGASQQESLRFTETLTKTVAISGVSVNEASQALLQFSQTMNKGKSDGDEFRNLMETMPVLANSIARQLGVARGELLKLAPTGAITAEVIRNAIQAMEEDIDRRMSGLALTIGQSFVILRNKTVEALGALQKQAGLFANGIVLLANNLENLAKITTIAVGAFVGYKTAMFFAVDATTKLSVATAILNGIMSVNPFVLAATGIAAAVTALYLYRNEIKLTSDGMITLGDAFDGIWESAKTLWAGIKEEVSKAAVAVYEKFKPVFDFLSDRIINTLTTYKQWALNILAIFNGLKSSILVVFRNFPKSLANVFIDAAALSIAAIKKLIVESTNLLSKVPGLGDVAVSSDSLDALVGFGPKRFEIKGGDAGQAFSEAFNKTLKEGFTLNTVFGDSDDAYSKIFRDIALNIKKASDARRKQESLLDSELRKEKEVNKELKDREVLLKALKDAEKRQKDVFAVESAIKGSDTRKTPEQAEKDKLKVKLAEERNLYNERAQFLKGVKDNDRVLIEGVNDAELTLFKTKQEALFALEEDYNHKKEQLTQESLDRIDKIKQEKRKEELAATASLLGSLSDLFGQFHKDDKKRNKAAFLASQAFALAQAGINVALGISEALKKDPPASYLLAAQTAVAGGIAIGQIAGAALTYKDGGLITGPGGPRSDSVPINASNGEFIVNAEATRRNKALLTAINAGQSVNTASNNSYSSSSFGLKNASSSTGSEFTSGKSVVVNVYNEEGVKAEVQTTENSKEIQIDLFVKKIDDRLAQNLNQNTGALTAALNKRRTRGF